MKRIILCMLLFFTIIGCAANVVMLTPQIKNSDTLMIGMEQKTTVGEPMIIKMIIKYYPGFIADNDYTPPSFMGIQMPTVHQNSELFCPKQLEDSTYCCKPVSSWGPIRILGRESPSERWNLIIEASGIPVGFIGDQATATVNRFSEKQPKVFKEAEVPQVGSFKQELIYNGKSKDTIKIAYREFKDDFARPAFYQDLSYDMLESREIGFRGMLIEILEATNSYVKFIVKKPMTN